MKFAWFLNLLVFCFFSFVVATGAYGVEVSIGPADLTLKTDEGRKPALFPHRMHQEAYPCTACHHARDDVMVIDKCSSCHNLDISKPALNSFKKAAHKMCKDCHKQVNDTGKDAPIKCSGCHVKQE